MCDNQSEEFAELDPKFTEFPPPPYVSEMDLRGFEEVTPLPETNVINNDFTKIPDFLRSRN